MVEMHVITLTAERTTEPLVKVTEEKWLMDDVGSIKMLRALLEVVKFRCFSSKKFLDFPH